jgi:hypothetical protein
VSAPARGRYFAGFQRLRLPLGTPVRPGIAAVNCFDVDTVNHDLPQVKGCFQKIFVERCSCHMQDVDLSCKMWLTCGMNIADLVRNHFRNNKAALAAVVGVTRQAVCHWGDDDVLKAEYVIPVCDALGWKVLPHMLRPDIYPNPLDGTPGRTV